FFFQERLVPGLRLRRPTWQPRSSPDDRKSATSCAVCFRALSILHGVRTRSFSIKKAQESREIDGLARRVKGIRGAWRSDADMEWCTRPVQVDHADGQAAVQRDSIAGVHGNVDGSQH